MKDVNGVLKSEPVVVWYIGNYVSNRNFHDFQVWLVSCEFEILTKCENVGIYLPTLPLITHNSYINSYELQLPL